MTRPSPAPLPLPKEARESLAQRVGREWSKCAKCGACAAVCPVYGEEYREACCARGKIMLARALARGELALSATTVDIFHNCLLCLACVKNCPSGVRLDTVMLAARQMLVQHWGLPLPKKVLYRHILARPRRMNRLLKGTARLQALALARVPGNSGLRLRFPLSLLPSLRDVPALPSLTPRPFRERVARLSEPAEQPKKQIPEARPVVYFTGCAANHFYPSVGEGTLFVLHKLGYTVSVPQGQVCCGTPALVGGAVEAARELALRNVDVLGKTEGPIVTTCGSCGLMLREHYAHVLCDASADTPPVSALSDIRERCTDISVFLWREVGAEGLRPLLQRQLRVPLTYHDPCHLGRGLNVTTEPRALLDLLAAQRVEMREAGRCCGSGGIYVASHAALSQRMLARKTAHARGAGASIVATGCPACMLQWEGGSRADGSGRGVFHTVELLAWSMGYETQNARERERCTAHLR